MSFLIRRATASDGEAVAAIYEPIVRNTRLSAEYVPPDGDEMARRIVETTSPHVWLVSEEEGCVNGYAYSTEFRSRAAYAWSTEVSVYIAEDARGKGVGRALYEHLFDLMRDAGFHLAMAVIGLPNPPSVSMHEKMGFVPVARFPKINFKNGEWYDIGIWALTLQEPTGALAARRPMLE